MGVNMSARPPRKLDSRYSWLVCLGAAVSNGVAFSVVFSFGVLLPVLMEEFHQSRERTALIGSLTFGLSYFASLACGKVCQRFSCRMCHIIGTLTCAVSLFISSWATGMTFMFLSLCLVYGLGLSLTFMPCFLIVGMYFDKRRSFGLGMVTTGVSAGFFMMGPIMEVLVKSVGWRNALRTLSGIMFSTSFISILFDPNVEKPYQSQGTRMNSSVESNERTLTIWRRLRKSLRFCKLPGYIIPAISLFIVSFSHGSVPIHFVQHCEEMGITSKKSSYLYLSIGIGSLVSRIGAGKLCETINPVYINQIGDFCSGIATVTLALTSNYPALVAITLLYGLADGIFYTTFNVVLFNAVDQEQRPYAYGCANTAASVAVTLGPMITGLVADVYSYREAFIMTGAITIVGGLVPLFLFCFKSDQQQEKEPEEILLVCEKETVV